MDHNLAALECINLYKEYVDGVERIQILSGINLRIAPGQQIAIMGRSGVGKTTLLQLLGGLDYPTAGKVLIAGENFNDCVDPVKSKLRNKYIGFIYQLHHLIPEFTALENVMLPLLIAKNTFAIAKDLAVTVLMQLDLGNRLNFYPNQLSGGEKQRVAIARAIITRPALILADEPTGNLDPHSAQLVLQVLKQLTLEQNTAMIVVTHDGALANTFDQIYNLEQGNLVLIK